MRHLIISIPLWVIAPALLAFFLGLSFAARELVRRRCDEETCRDLANQANSLITGLAATFAFFVGFAITVTWGAVSAGQAAIDKEANAIQQMSWDLKNIRDEAESQALLDKLRAYSAAAVGADIDYLVNGDTGNLPSVVLFDQFEDAVHEYAFSPKAAPQEVGSLVAAAAEVGNASGAVSVVAGRTLPGVLAALLLTSGVIVAAVMGISTVTLRRPFLAFIWAVIPAFSITVVIALEFPFAHGIGVNLTPLQAVAQSLKE